MPPSRSPLSYDVFTAPSKLFVAPPPRVGDQPAWVGSGDVDVDLRDP
jgi:hypothetical protein